MTARASKRWWSASRGTTDRPDGSTYHITWSLSPGRRAKESNDVIAKLGWEPLELPMPVKLDPAQILMRRLYLDCDGVLADFDHGATAILGMKPKAFEHRHGLGALLAEAGDGARFLLQPAADAGRDAAVRCGEASRSGHPHRPSRGNWAADQKMRWAAQHFPGRAHDHLHGPRQAQPCQGGDVLVDDNDKFRHLWEAAGRHLRPPQECGDSIAELANYFPLKEDAPPA
jgi:hypothetical protein